MTANLSPAMHPTFKMNSRIEFSDFYIGQNGENKVKGAVVGISIVGLIFHYIVLLDEEINSDYGIMKAISIIGTALNEVSE